jgi:hypothetical protein
MGSEDGNHMAMIGSILWQYGNNIYGNIYIEHGSI